MLVYRKAKGLIWTKIVSHNITQNTILINTVISKFININFLFSRNLICFIDMSSCHYLPCIIYSMKICLLWQHSGSHISGLSFFLVYGRIALSAPIEIEWGHVTNYGQLVVRRHHLQNDYLIINNSTFSFPSGIGLTILSWWLLCKLCPWVTMKSRDNTMKDI